jgi:hypothetical protein
VYIELYPGPYREKCWCSDSVFLTEEAFAFVEPIFRRHTPNYDYYTFMELPRICGCAGDRRAHRRGARDPRRGAGGAAHAERRGGFRAYRAGHQ